MTPSSAIATETKQIGQILKDLRRQHGLTGEELGRKVNLSQSKISKIEIGYYPTLNSKEIENILNILDAPKTIRQQINRLLDQVEPSTAIQRPYALSSIENVSKIESEATSVLMFAFNSIPCIFQTYAYREASMLRYGCSPEEMPRFIQDMLRRQELLWDTKRSYHVILHQASLYTRPVSKGQQLAQLDRLQTFVDLPNIKLGIIPIEAGLSLVESSNFVIHDGKRLFLCLAKTDVETYESEDVAIHKKVFLELDYLAHYGDEAKKLIRQAMEHFS